jgi:hypothetical protein
MASMNKLGREFEVSFLSELKAFITGNNSNSSSSGQQGIVINARSDGQSLTGLPSHIATWVFDHNTTLKCNDGTNLPIRAKHALITGVSAHKNEILTRQIVAGIREGYTPVVLSNNGRQGGLFSILRTIYPENTVKYLADSADSECYNPFGGVPHSLVAEFFYQLITTMQRQVTNGMLVRNYVNVCVRVFFSNTNALGILITGELNHTRLLMEIQNMHRSNAISDQQRMELENAANTAQSVSVTVFSTIQDYLYKMQRASASRPSIQIRSSNAPRITILNNNNQQLQINQASLPRVAGGFDSSIIREQKCFFMKIDNDIQQNYTFNNTPNEQCYQWYLSRTLQMEMDAKPEVKNGKILLIVENVSSLHLNWFSWLFDLPNCIILLCYDDFYSKLADAQERRQQLLGRMQRIFFFSVMEEQSAGWASRFFGTHMVPKTVVTETPGFHPIHILFRPKAYAHDEVEKPWFSTHEILQLGDTGIVYSKEDQIFKACYRESGATYEDKNYKRRVNFCTFGFR